MAFWHWSRTAGSNATADPTINMAEGMAPSAVNDGIRAQMARLREYGDDIAGAIVTGGTATAYTVSSYQSFTSLSVMNGQILAFTPHVTSGATVTLNVDGLGAKPLRSAPNAELPAGVLIQGTPYLVLYNNADQAFYLQGFYGNPYNIPIGGLMDFIGPTAPNSSFVFPFGQAISRTAYAALFALAGTTYGPGDGSTTFNVPDLRGRVVAGKDDMGGAAASRLTSTFFGTSAAALGAVGGLESHTLQTTEIPSHSHANSLSDPGHAHAYTFPTNVGNTGGGGAFGNSPAAGTTGAATTGITINNAAAGGGGAHKNVQPTIICNKLLRII